MKISLLDKEHVPLFAGDIVDLSFEESLVVQKSIEFFRDEEPCMIHRSAVRMRLCLEIESALAGCGKTAVTAIPQEVGAYFGAYPEVDHIVLLEDIPACNKKGRH